MVALAIATCFILATVSVFGTASRFYREQERISDAQQSVRAAMDLMVRDIRMAGYDPMAMTHGPEDWIGIVSADETHLQFTADLNADRIDNGLTENLTYFYDSVGKRLQQKQGGAYVQTFIDNVSAVKFEYFDADGEPVADIDQIAVVKVTLSVTDRDHRGGVFERTLATRINCRNLRF